MKTINKIDYSSIYWAGHMVFSNCLSYFSLSYFCYSYIITIYIDEVKELFHLNEEQIGAGETKESQFLKDRFHQNSEQTN